MSVFELFRSDCFTLYTNSNTKAVPPYTNILRSQFWTFWVQRRTKSVYKQKSYVFFRLLVWPPFLKIFFLYLFFIIHFALFEGVSSIVTLTSTVTLYSVGNGKVGQCVDKSYGIHGELYHCTYFYMYTINYLLFAIIK